MSTAPEAKLRRLGLLTVLAASLLLCDASFAAAQTLRVGTSGDYPPFSTEERPGILRGIDIDIANQMASAWNMRVELVRFQWPRLLADLRDGKFDVVMSGVTMRPERAIEGRFTRPYARTGAVALIRKVDATRFPSIEALNAAGRKVAVNRGGHLERVTRRFFPRASIQTVPANRSLPSLLRSATVDAIISDSAEAAVVRQEDLVTIGPFTSDYKAFLLPAGSAALANRADEWLAQREADGWLNRLRQKWLANAKPTDERGATRQAIVAAISLRLGLMPFVAATKRAEKRPIEDTNQEARVLARVRNLSPSDPKRTEAVYRVLIRIAKEVQRTVAPADEVVPLSSLRDAIARIDEELVRELDRLPSSRGSDWTPLLSIQLADLSIAPELQEQLAGVLSQEPKSP